VERTAEIAAGLAMSNVQARADGSWIRTLTRRWQAEAVSNPDESSALWDCEPLPSNPLLTGEK
jgi:hypothetical protein